MNKKGFTLVELLATLVILGIIVGITLITVNGGFGKAKDKTEDAFISTLEDALDIYLDTDARSLTYEDTYRVIHKTHGRVNLYKANKNISFNDIINSSMHPIDEDDFVNPANKDGDCKSKLNKPIIEIYRDSDFVYYYQFDKEELGDNCFITTGIVSILPESESESS